VLGPDGRGEGACPDCGLGFSSSAVFSRRAEGPLRAWWSRRWGRRHLESHRSQRDQVLRRRPFPIYGLDARWTGLRWAGGWGGSDDEIDHIGLGYGDPFDDAAPLVRVFTWRLSPPMERLTVANAAQGLAESLWRDGGAPHDLVRSAFTSEDPTASWPELVLSLDGNPATFRSLAEGSFWVALARTEECLITVEARRISPDDIGLMAVDDVEPYLVDGPSPH
jgi:hypothetical protein